MYGMVTRQLQGDTRKKVVMFAKKERGLATSAKS